MTTDRRRTARGTMALTLAALGLCCVETGVIAAGATDNLEPTPEVRTIQRQQKVLALPGGLDQVMVVNDNNPELITDDGILLSTFPDKPGLNQPLDGRFDLFSHHVYAGTPEQLDSTLWLAVLAQPVGDGPVTLELVGGSTSLSQATAPGQTAAPFLPLPALMSETSEPIAAGPGSRVAGDLLRGSSAPELPKVWTLEPGAPSSLMVLPIPVAGLDPLLNGRNLQLRLRSSGPVYLATLAAQGNNDDAPTLTRWQELLRSGRLSPKEHMPTPRGSRGKMIYSRVSGIQVGSRWAATITDPGTSTLSLPQAPISWPISSLERGELGTGQVQTAELQAFSPGTAWAAHGNYGVEYDIRLPLHNPGRETRSVAIALESPIKSGSRSDSLRFQSPAKSSVMFRGPVEVRGLDGSEGRPSGRRLHHLVLHQGMEGPVLGRVTLAPGASRRVQVRLIYPADATPPQVLSVLPVKQSTATVSVSP
ncbi:DUF3370 domain-containing protein [Synechococcus sp. MIT S9451]|uniref:DUF3370 domain-containing protein n=1 Tax=Synechococcus sp. MIT S9451 TaxID=3082543 RepID=UPI0039B46078